MARGFIFHQLNLDARAVGALELHVAEQPTDSVGLNMLAWTYATAGAATVRNPGRAVHLARKAVELSGWKNEAYVDTLIQAHLAAESYEDARAVLNKSLALGYAGAILKRRQAEFAARPASRKDR